MGINKISCEALDVAADEYHKTYKKEPNKLLLDEDNYTQLMDILDATKIDFMRHIEKVKDDSIKGFKFI